MPQDASPGKPFLENPAKHRTSALIRFRPSLKELSLCRTQSLCTKCDKNTTGFNRMKDGTELQWRQEHFLFLGSWLASNPRRNAASFVVQRWDPFISIYSSLRSARFCAPATAAPFCSADKRARTSFASHAEFARSATSRCLTCNGNR